MPKAVSGDDLGDLVLLSCAAMSHSLQTMFVPGTSLDLAFVKNIFDQLCSSPADIVESDYVEVKGWCKDERQLSEKISESAACLANSSGGLVVVGVEEATGVNDRFSSCPHSVVTTNWLLARVQDLTFPPVDCTAHDMSEMLSDILNRDGAEVFVLWVSKTKHISGHITVKGISKKRVGKDCKPNYSAEDDRTKSTVPDVSLADLNTTSIEWAISQHHRKFGTPAGQWAGPSDFLCQGRLLEQVSNSRENGFRIPLATVLLFGSEQCLKKCVGYFETLVNTKTPRPQRFRRNIVELVRELCWTRNSLVSSLCPKLSPETIRELIVNAYIHRCYRTGGPVVINASNDLLEVQSPGDLPGGLTPDNLIYCIPVYRNLLLADGARFIGICDAIGHGIDVVYRSVLTGGFEFPMFESGGGQFAATIPLKGSDHFREFVRDRSQALTQLDEIVVLRVLWSRESASAQELCSAMQRGADFGQQVLRNMCQKAMIEQDYGAASVYKLTPVLRNDIENVFQRNQMSFDVDLFGGPN